MSKLLDEEGNFTGLFDRQSSLDLNINEWYTIYIDWEVFDNNKWIFLREFIKGLSMIGCLGVTIVVNRNIYTWDDINITLDNHCRRDIHLYRPWFRILICNSFQLNETPEIIQGKKIFLTEGNPISSNFHTNENILCIDIKFALVAKTNDISNFSLTVFSELTNEKINKPHWKDSESIVIYLNLLTLLAINVLCKPEKFENNSFFFVTDFADSIISDIIEDRQIKIRATKCK
jgi:hypothetical protein